MRPILIHKYEKDKTARAQEFYDMFNDQGDEVRKLYTKQKTRAVRQATTTDKHSATGSNTGSYLEKAMKKQSKRRASKIVFVEDAEAAKNSLTSTRQSLTVGSTAAFAAQHRDMLKSSPK